jgi:glycosyltransferase involved in cell wall biosynthesis
MSTRLSILIPAYNEAGAIGKVVHELKQAGFAHVLVVNDGSRDATEEVARQAGAEVLSHPINRGQGAALQTGIEYLREVVQPDVVITFDADGQHLPSDIEKIAKPVLEGVSDVALGSRFLKNAEGVPASRKAMLKGAVLFTNTLSGVQLTDTHNGFRALGKKALSKINLTQRGMEHASEIIDEIKRHRLRYVEVPVTIRYTEYSQKKGQRTSNFVRLGIKILLRKIMR